MLETQDCTNGGLRADYIRTDAPMSNGRFTTRLPDDVAERLDALANGNLFLAYVAVLSAIAIHLRQHGDQERFIVYSPAMQRGATRLPVRIDFAGLRSFRDVLEFVRQRLQGIYQSPETARWRGDEGAATVVSLEGLHADADGESPELHVRYLHARREMVYRYNQALYRPDTIACTAQRVFDLLGMGVAAPDTALRQMWSIHAREAALVCGEWNETAVDYARDRSL